MFTLSFFISAVVHVLSDIFARSAALASAPVQIPGGFKFEGLEIFNIPASRVDMDVGSGGNR